MALRVSRVREAAVPIAPVAGAADWAYHEPVEHVFGDAPGPWLLGDVSVQCPTAHYPCGGLAHCLMAVREGVLPPRELFGAKHGAGEVSFGDHVAYAECIAPRIPLARGGFSPANAPLTGIHPAGPWRPRGWSRFRVHAGPADAEAPAWMDVERCGARVALDVVSDDADRPSMRRLQRGGDLPRWQYMDRVIAYLRGSESVADPPSAFPPGLGPRGGRDAAALAVAWFGDGGRACEGDGPGFRTYAVFHLVAPARDSRTAGPRCDELDALRRHGAVAEIVVVRAHVGNKLVVEPFLHVVGRDSAPPPPVDVNSPFEFSAPEEGLPSVFALLLAWDFLVRSRTCLVYAQVGGTGSNIDAWWGKRPSLFRDAVRSRPTLRDLFRRGDHSEFVRALVFEAALFA
eukprot:gene3744-21236_t